MKSHKVGMCQLLQCSFMISLPAIVLQIFARQLFFNEKDAYLKLIFPILTM
jgi:hypothetical protein